MAPRRPRTTLEKTYGYHLRAEASANADYEDYGMPQSNYSIGRMNSRKPKVALNPHF